MLSSLTLSLKAPRLYWSICTSLWQVYKVFVQPKRLQVPFMVERERERGESTKTKHKNIITNTNKQVLSHTQSHSHTLFLEL